VLILPGLENTEMVTDIQSSVIIETHITRAACEVQSHIGMRRYRELCSVPTNHAQNPG
jgi:hypothetical protein